MEKLGSVGTPMRSPSQGDLHRKPRESIYQNPMASRSTTDLPSSASFGRAYGECPLSASGVPPRSRSVRLSRPTPPSIATRPAQGLASTAVEHIREEIPITTEVRRTTDRIRRFLLWNLVFIYGIHREMFRYCLIEDEASVNGVFGSYELDADDEGHMYSLGLCLQRACDRVEQNQLSLLIAHDRSRITKDVVIPAKILNIEPEYLCEQLMSYPKHKFQPEKRHKTVLHSHGGRNRFFRFARKWNNEDSKAHLAKCLVSDDCVVSAITPTEILQVMLGRCIAEFSNKHRKKGLSMGSVERKVYFQDSTHRLLQAVMIRNQIAQQNVRNTLSQSWSKSASAYQQYALESLQTPFDPRSTVLREEYEEEEAESLRPTRIP